jgi:hypothetical protein
MTQERVLTLARASDWADEGTKPCIPGRKTRGKAIRYDRCSKTVLSAVALAATVIFWL